MPVAIAPLAAAGAEEAAAVTALLAGLSSSGRTLAPDALAALLAQPGATLLVAREAGRMVGMTTLVLYRIPTGLKAVIEDVVVAPDQRGKGTGAALVAAALERAREAGAKGVDLTSRPSRAAANRLYLRLGFAQRETNVFRYEFPKA